MKRMNITSKFQKSCSNVKRWFPLYLMMLPAFIYLFINNYLPMAGLIIAFKRYNAKLGIWASPWIGFENFKFLLASRDFKIIIRNTLGYNTAFIILDVVLGVFLAILITEIEKKKHRKIFQSAVLLPYVMSIIIISYMTRAFIDPQTGMINHIMVTLGKEKINFYNETKYWPAILCFIHCWKATGYGCLMYISTILGISPSLFEAASIDGATKMQKIRYITLPFLKPTVITLTLLAIGHIFNSDFGLFYQVPQNSGIIYDVTQTIDTFVYQALMSSSSIGMSAATGFFQSVVGFLMIIIFNGIVRKVSKENAIF